MDWHGVTFVTPNICCVHQVTGPPYVTLFLALLNTLAQLDNVIIHVNSGGCYYYHFIDEQTERVK